MLEKHLNTLKTGISGIVFITLGVIIACSRSTLVFNLVQIFGLVFLVTAFFTFLDWLFHPLSWHQLLTFIAEIGLSIFVYTYPDIPMAILPLLFSVVLFLHGVTHFITMIIFWKAHLTGWIGEMLLTCTYFILFCLMFLEPLVHLDDLLLVIGVYLIVYGISDIKDALYEEMKVSTKNKLRRKVRLQLPVVLAALIPHSILTYINHYFEENEEEDKQTIIEYKKEVKPDIEVLIHVTSNGYGALGHVDICYQDHIISYGNYDASSRKLHDAIGDGVLIIAPKETYIPFCIRDSKKTLFGFGLTLTEKQKAAVNKRLKEFTDNLEPWYPQYQIAEKNGDKETMQASLKLYENRLYQATKADMFKFKSGRFKTYFVMTTNCVALADTIIGKTGIDIVGTNGIITPGTYYDYFNREFMKSNTNVISRTIYR